ncbi:MAG: cytochrome-c peroxidase [Chitinophagaceae bacterium]|nr:cytochrome-c peroxidase [Chitinophagaceae bacterium]
MPGKISILTFFFLILLTFLIGAGKADQTPMTKERLGKKLFFDPILSSDRSISCASCHKPELAFADSTAFSTGVMGRKTARNTPSIMNMAMRDLLFWDGRAPSLEAQVVFPVENPNEMNLPFAEAVQRIKADQTYRQLFLKVYKRLPDSADIVNCIAAYERSLETDQTPSDRWLNDVPGAMTAQQIRGRELFTSDRTRCFDCHFTPDFTSDEFRNIGLFNGRELNDSGRYRITKNPEDIGKFKIPGLRNVAMTAPYMHNGQFKTLREVIDYYDDPAGKIHGSIGRDTILPVKIGLTEQEKQDLESYLQALTDDRFSKKRKK